MLLLFSNAPKQKMTKTDIKKSVLNLELRANVEIFVKRRQA